MQVLPAFFGEGCGRRGYVTDSQNVLKLNLHEHKHVICWRDEFGEKIINIQRHRLRWPLPYAPNWLKRSALWFERSLPHQTHCFGNCDWRRRHQPMWTTHAKWKAYSEDRLITHAPLRPAMVKTPFFVCALRRESFFFFVNSTSCSVLVERFSVHKIVHVVLLLPWNNLTFLYKTPSTCECVFNAI